MNNSDSTILSEIMKTNNFKEYFKSSDTFIVDRGFPDILPEIEKTEFN